MRQALLEREFEVPQEWHDSHNSERRHRNDTETWLAEVLEGSMRTSFEYIFDGRELYGSDGGALEPIFKTSIKDAEIIAATNPDLQFELRRRKIENAEYGAMIGMARGELPNTMVVVSDFPPELMSATQDIGGYNTRRKQTMLRVITCNDGVITMRSQSLDRSDRQALETIYEYNGFTPQPGELLGQRMHLDLPAEKQEFLADWLTGIYDRSLEVSYGGKWHAGRTPAELLNTYDFVCKQDDLVDAFVRAKLNNSVNAEKLRYGLAAAMESRFKQRLARTVIGLENREATYLRSVPLHEMEYAGQLARAAGKVFSGCGRSEGGQMKLSTQDQLSESGLGNRLDEDDFGPLTFKCGKGHTNTRPRNKLIDKCTTCHVSVKC